MKVLFLDIDGVLNFTGTEARTPAGYVGIVDSLVKKLKKIIDDTGAIIVLSSDWKGMWDRNIPDNDLSPDARYLVRKLNRRGLHISSKIDDIVPLKDRGTAIIKWLEDNTLGEIRWCVLDDTYFDDFKAKHIDKHLVMTNVSIGLSDSDVEKAIDILNGYEEGEKTE